MTILKQSPSKNQRSKGFKVKHFLQICFLVAICFWLLRQVKNSYDGNKAPILSELQSEPESIKLGRKDIHFPIQHTTLERETLDADETEENETEESKDEGIGGGDDEIDGSDQDKSEEEELEEVEDLIDEDREREDETAEQESEDAENQFEDENLLVNQEQYEGESSLEAREEHYKGENAAAR